MAKNEMNDQLRVRRQKMDEMRENGIEPFGQRKFDRQDLAATLDEKYGNEDKDELNNDMPKTKVAGRMLAKRGKGKVLPTFMTVLARFKFTYVRISLVKKTTRFLRNLILVTS